MEDQTEGHHGHEANIRVQDLRQVRHEEVGEEAGGGEVMGPPPVVLWRLVLPCGDSRLCICYTKKTSYMTYT